jgi:hypothetical protein
MIDETEAMEFERRRQAAWKSAFQGAGSSGSEYARKKKKQLTLAERQQQIKGLSKAFVNPGAGWAKVDPVHIVEDEEDSESHDDNEDRPNHVTKDSQEAHLASDSMTVPSPSRTTEPSKQKPGTILPTTNEAMPPRDMQHQMEIQVLDRILQMARSHGPSVALSWAQQQIQKSGASNSSNQEKNAHLPVQDFSSFLPLPVRLLAFNTPQAVDHERQHFAHFHEAALYTPYEYTSSPDVMFVIRRPYGYESRPGLFERMSELPNDLYKRKAHISTIETLEVAVVLKPNLAVLLLYGDENVKYRASQTQRTFQGGNLKMCLGTIAYQVGSDPTTQAPKFYSLDALAQHALSLRQQYAVTVTSTAMSLFKTKSIKESNATKVVPSFDVGVDTSDLVAVTTKSVATNTTPPTAQNARVQHFSWWIRKKLPTMLLRGSGRWSTLLYLVVLAGVLYMFFMNQSLVHDPSTPRTRQAEG